MILENKHILLGISGSIAVYKAPELIRLLQREGATVQVMATHSALNFVTALTLETLSGFPLLKNIFDQGMEMAHIQASRKADLVLIAPATAHLIAKFASGMADDIVAATVLASKAPVLIAPAMNGAMWENVLVQENIKKLKKASYRIIEPGVGLMACGEYGEGRLADLNGILYEIKRACTIQDFKGKKIVISGGATREYLDPVRFLSNASSGKMAISLALEAFYRGGEVIFITGYGDAFNIDLPKEIKRIKVGNAQAMFESVSSYLSTCDVFISAAAVSDYSFKKVVSRKIKKEKENFTLILQPTVDILQYALTLSKRPYIVGFALETHDLLYLALKKFQKKGVDLMILNDHHALDATDAKVSFLIKQGFQHFPVLSKKAISKNIFDHVVKSFSSEKY